MSTHHIIPPRTYYIVFGLLLALMVITIVAAQFDFGVMNPIIAVGIATGKALLIVLYFMHIRYAAPLVRVIAFAGVVWLILGAVLTMSDYTTRDLLTPNRPVLGEESRPEAVDRTQRGSRTQTPGQSAPEFGDE